MVSDTETESRPGTTVETMASITRKASEGTARRDAVVARILDAVERLLASGRSFTELSVADIASEAGVARSSFYVHFADKTDLLIRVADDATSEVFDHAEQWMESGPRHRQDELVATLERIISHYRRNQHLFEAVLAGTGYDPTIAAFWRARIEGMVSAGRELLDSMVDAGRLDVDPESLSRMIAWSIERTITTHVADHDESTDSTLARTMARALWSMVFGATTPIVAAGTPS